MIEQNLKWSPHLKYINARFRKSIYKFEQFTYFLDLKILQTIYFALVENTISYGILIYDDIYNTNPKILNITQMWIMKILFKKHKDFFIYRLHQRSGIPNIRQLFIRKIPFINQLGTLVSINATAYLYQIL